MVKDPERLTTEEQETISPLVQASIDFIRASVPGRDADGNLPPDYFHTTYEAFLLVVRESSAESADGGDRGTEADPGIEWVPTARQALRKAANLIGGPRGLDRTLLLLPGQEDRQRRLYDEMRGRKLGQVSLTEPAEDILQTPPESV